MSQLELGIDPVFESAPTNPTPGPELVAVMADDFNPADFRFSD
jgi:hypothetical protein